MSLIFANIVIAQWAARIMIAFNSFFVFFVLIIRDTHFASIPIKSLTEDSLTFLLRIFVFSPPVLYWIGLERVFQGYHDPMALLQEESAERVTTSPVLSSERDENNLRSQDNIERSEEDTCLEDAPLIHDTGTMDEPLQDIITSEQDGRKVRNIFGKMRRRISLVSFIRDPGRPVNKYFLLCYMLVLALDSVCFSFWILSVMRFPWNKNRWSLVLANMVALKPTGKPVAWPNGTLTEFVPDGTMRYTAVWNAEQIQTWSAWWWPTAIFEIVESMVFLVIYIAEWTIIISPLIIWWRGSSPHAINQRPKGRRVILASQAEIAHLYQDDEPTLVESSLAEHADGIELADVPQESQKGQPVLLL